MPDRKEEPSLGSCNTGTESGTAGGVVRKFLNNYEEKIKSKQDNIYSYFCVFGQTKKTLPILFEETLCGVGCGKTIFGQSEACDKNIIGRKHGHQCEGGKFSEGKRKFSQGEVCGKQQPAPSKKQK